MFNQESITQLKDAILKANSVGILVGENPDLDTMAAALAIYLTLSQASKKVSICCKTPPIVEISSLVGIDKVEKQFSSGNDLTISLPYKQGNIEKISYNISGDRINLVIKAGADGLLFEPSDIRYLQTGGTVDCVVAVGIENKSSVEELVSLDENTTVVNIDNKFSNEQFGQLIFVAKSASSISELVAYLISSLGLPMDIDLAQNLLSGIGFATNNFQDEKTSSLAFEMTGLLLKHGARRDFSGPTRDLSQPFFISPTTPKSFLKKREDKSKRDADAPPSDWLAPKIYKGSTAV